MNSVVYKYTNKVLDNEIVQISTTTHFQSEIIVFGQACLLHKATQSAESSDIPDVDDILVHLVLDVSGRRVACQNVDISHRTKKSQTKQPLKHLPP